MVPGEGVEPSLPRGNRILNPARLPIPPSGQLFYKWGTKNDFAIPELECVIQNQSKWMVFSALTLDETIF